MYFLQVLLGIYRKHFTFISLDLNPKNSHSSFSDRDSHYMIDTIATIRHYTYLLHNGDG